MLRYKSLAELAPFCYVLWYCYAHIYVEAEMLFTNKANFQSKRQQVIVKYEFLLIDIDNRVQPVYSLALSQLVCKISGRTIKIAFLYELFCRSKSLGKRQGTFRSKQPFCRN